MLVSTIITNGQLLADVPNTSFYTAVESLFAVQLAWEQIYAFLASNNDDYNLVVKYLNMPSATSPSPSVSTDANRTHTYLIDTLNVTDFPPPTVEGPTSGFYRLRLIQYQGMGGNNQYMSVNKSSIEQFGNTSQTPAYRFEGQYVAIYDPGGYSKYCIWYYPRPVTLLTTTDISYPYNMIPEIMAYQVAAEIRRKQKADPAPWTSRVKELYDTMKQQLSRDDSHGEPVKNQFGSGYAPYI